MTKQFNVNVHRLRDVGKNILRNILYKASFWCTISTKKVSNCDCCYVTNHQVTLKWHFVIFIWQSFDYCIVKSSRPFYFNWAVNNITLKLLGDSEVTEIWRLHQGVTLRAALWEYPDDFILMSLGDSSQNNYLQTVKWVPKWHNCKVTYRVYKATGMVTSEKNHKMTINWY